MRHNDANAFNRREGKESENEGEGRASFVASAAADVVAAAIALAVALALSLAMHAAVFAVSVVPAAFLVVTSCLCIALCNAEVRMRAYKCAISDKLAKKLFRLTSIG
jgi:hypothetical protein